MISIDKDTNQACVTVATKGFGAACAQGLLADRLSKTSTVCDRFRNALDSACRVRPTFHVELVETGADHERFHGTSSKRAIALTKIA